MHWERHRKWKIKWDSPWKWHFCDMKNEAFFHFCSEREKIEKIIWEISGFRNILVWILILSRKRCDFCLRYVRAGEKTYDRWYWVFSPCLGLGDRGKLLVIQRLFTVQWVTLGRRSLNKTKLSPMNELYCRNRLSFSHFKHFLYPLVFLSNEISAFF